MTDTCYIRDEDYYFKDGNMILLVKNRLFKIHGGLFSRMSAVFQALFSLPQSDDNTEGQSDKNPIIFYDKLEDFQALCWVTYATPQEILRQENFDEMDVSKLVSVASISHKYNIAVFRDWALGVLEKQSSINRLVDFVKKFLPWGRLSTTLVLAKQYKRDVLADGIEEMILTMIMLRGPAQPLRIALSAAERCNDLREFHGKAYYQHLVATRVFDVVVSKHDPIGVHQLATPTADDTLTKLSDHQKLRLYQGFWSLSLLRIQLLQAPKLEDNPACVNHVRTCIPVWQEWWKELLAGMDQNNKSRNDPFQIMKEVEKRSKYPIISSRFGLPPCDAQIRAQAQNIAEDFFDTLPDRFMIP